jgi:hypothetical protein
MINVRVSGDVPGYRHYGIVRGRDIYLKLTTTTAGKAKSYDNARSAAHEKEPVFTCIRNMT